MHKNLQCCRDRITHFTTLRTFVWRSWHRCSANYPAYNGQQTPRDIKADRVVWPYGLTYLATVMSPPGADSCASTSSAVLILSWRWPTRKLSLLIAENPVGRQCNRWVSRPLTAGGNFMLSLGLMQSPGATIAASCPDLPLDSLSVIDPGTGGGGSRGACPSNLGAGGRRPSNIDTRIIFSFSLRYVLFHTLRPSWSTKAISLSL